MKVALLCSGLGHIVRGHEVFARGLFDMLAGSMDITLFKGSGVPAPNELVIPNVPRTSACLNAVHVCVGPAWTAAVQEQERLRIEHETFAYAALGPLLDGEFDVVHCLEQEVCMIVWANRHLFAKPPKILFSNGGAIAAASLPHCDAVQEHTRFNLERSARRKAFMIPHGVDVQQFRPGATSCFRKRHGIPSHVRLLLSVGTVCVNHKRMDHVIREVAQLGDDVVLAVVGQENSESAAIRDLGHELLGQRVVFDKLQHEDLPQAYAAADAFVLGSLFETFGIVYIEAMASGLPVFCTDHPNQKQIVQQGVFVDMKTPGALAAALRDTPTERLAELGHRARLVAEQQYDLRILREQYVLQYRALADAPSSLPTYSLRTRWQLQLRKVLRHSLHRLTDDA